MKMALLVLPALAATLYAAPPADGDWTLTFADEFDGTHLDGSKWKTGQHWTGTSGDAQIHPDNIEVRDGALRITWDKKDSAFTFGRYVSQYGTGEISSFGRFRQRYGYFECRLKYDVHRGCWPAFWTMPEDTALSAEVPVLRSYLKADLSGVPVDSCAAAYLVLAGISVPADALFDVYPVVDDAWSGTAVTWNSLPAHDGIFLHQAHPDTGAGTVITVPVTRFVNKELAGDRTASFMLADMYHADKTVALHGPAADSANRPYLLVDGTRVPVTEAAYVDNRRPDTNYGAGAQLYVREGYRWGIVDTYTPGMEIDIYESLGIWGPYETSHAWHWNGYGADHEHGSVKVQNIADQNGYNTYGVYWKKDTLAFYVNDRHTHTHAGPEVCAVPSFMILSAQLGGWDANDSGYVAFVDNDLPLRMHVDWVRAWAGSTRVDSAPAPPDTFVVFADSAGLRVAAAAHKDCSTYVTGAEAYEGDSCLAMAYDYTGWFAQYQLLNVDWNGRFAVTGYDTLAFAYKGAAGRNVSVVLVDAEGTATQLPPVPGNGEWTAARLPITGLAAPPRSIQVNVNNAETGTGTLYVDGMFAYMARETSGTRAERPAAARTHGAATAYSPAGLPLGAVRNYRGVVIIRNADGSCRKELRLR